MTRPAIEPYWSTLSVTLNASIPIDPEDLSQGYEIKPYVNKVEPSAIYKDNGVRHDEAVPLQGFNFILDNLSQHIRCHNAEIDALVSGTITEGDGVILSGSEVSVNADDGINVTSDGVSVDALVDGGILVSAFGVSVNVDDGMVVTADGIAVDTDYLASSGLESFQGRFRVKTGDGLQLVEDAVNGGDFVALDIISSNSGLLLNSSGVSINPPSLTNLSSVATNDTLMVWDVSVGGLREMTITQLAAFIGTTVSPATIGVAIGGTASVSSSGNVTTHTTTQTLVNGQDYLISFIYDYNNNSNNRSVIDLSLLVGGTVQSTKLNIAHDEDAAGGRTHNCITFSYTSTSASAVSVALRMSSDNTGTTATCLNRIIKIEPVN